MRRGGLPRGTCTSAKSLFRTEAKQSPSPSTGRNRAAERQPEVTKHRKGVKNATLTSTESGLFGAVLTAVYLRSGGALRIVVYARALARSLANALYMLKVSEPEKDLAPAGTSMQI